MLIHFDFYQVLLVSMLFSKKTFAILCMLVNFVSFNTHLLTRAPWGQERGKRRIMSFLLLKPLKIGKKIAEFIFAIAVSHCSLDQIRKSKFHKNQFGINLFSQKLIPLRYIETSPLICSKKQWNDFYMIQSIDLQQKTLD